MDSGLRRGCSYLGSVARMGRDDSDSPSFVGRTKPDALHVVDSASLSFVELGEARLDSYDLSWEFTPAAAPERPRGPSLAETPAGPDPTPMPPLRDPERQPSPQAAVPPLAEALSSAGRTAVPLEEDIEPEEGPPVPPPELAQRAVRPAPPSALPDASALSSRGVEAVPLPFRSLPLAVFSEALPSFDVFDLFAGETLLLQGDRHPALVMVLRGVLNAERHGRTRRVRPGGVRGLTALFGDGTWPSSLRSLTDCRLMVLELESFQALRSQGHPIASSLETWSMQCLLEAHDAAADELRQVLRARPLESLVPSRGFLSRFAAAIGGGGITSTKLDVVASLQASPLFRNAQRSDVSALAKHSEGVRAQRGEFLITQGERAEYAYLLVGGAVDVISASGPDSAVHHESLRPGDLFGVWSMVRDTPPNAYYVAMDRNTTLIEISREAWRDVTGDAEDRGSVLRLAALRGLTSRVVRAWEAVANLYSGGGPARETSGQADQRFVTILPAGRR